MTEENKTEDTVTERLKASIDKLRLIVDVVADKALERAIIIEETTKELDAMALEIEGRETELLGGEKVEEEIEGRETELLGGEKVEEEIEEVLTEIDNNPHSPTFNQEIPVA